MHLTKKTTFAGLAAVAVISGSAFAAPLLASADDAGRGQAHHSSHQAEPGDDNGGRHHAEPGDDNGRRHGEVEPGDDHGHHGQGSDD